MKIYAPNELTVKNVYACIEKFPQMYKLVDFFNPHQQEYPESERHFQVMFTVVAKVKHQAIIFNNEKISQIMWNKGVTFLVDPDDSYVPTQTGAVTILLVSPSKLHTKQKKFN